MPLQLPYSKWLRDLGTASSTLLQMTTGRSRGTIATPMAYGARRPASVQVGSTAISAERLTIPYSC